MTIYGESQQHFNAKLRLKDLLLKCTPPPDYIVDEYEYPNEQPGKWPYRFDVFASWDSGLKIAIEVDGKVGHYSPRSYKKREHRAAYLRSKGIELYGYPTQWLVGKKALPDSLFYEEMHLADS